MKVAVVMGSDSDLPIMKETVETLKYFDVDSFVCICSAHRTPEKIKDFLKDVEENKCEVIVAGAGMAAHLPGVIASYTHLPVIGVPLSSSPLNGLDSLYAIVQMPRGVPVATVAIGKSGAVNAGILAVEILALKYEDIRNKLKKYKQELAQSIIKKDNELKKKGIEKYLDEKAK